MARMFNPPQPGETIREDILPALGITVTAAAKQLGTWAIRYCVEAGEEIIIARGGRPIARRARCRSARCTPRSFHVDGKR